MKQALSFLLGAMCTTIVHGERFKKCGNEGKAMSEGLLEFDRQNAARRGPLNETAQAIALAAPKVVDLYMNIITYKESDQDLFPDSLLQRQFDILQTAFSSSGFSFRVAGVYGWYDWNWSSSPTGQNQQLTALRAQAHKGKYNALNLYFLPGLTELKGLYGECSGPVYPTPTDEILADDGCIIDHGTLPGSSDPQANLGYTTVHEVGHWFGLMHPWGPFEVGYCNDDDAVADTPVQYGPSFQETGPCTTTKDSCPQKGIDDTSNYMDYSPDYCMNHFTPGQVVRMAETWILREPKGNRPGTDRCNEVACWANFKNIEYKSLQV